MHLCRDLHCSSVTLHHQCTKSDPPFVRNCQDFIQLQVQLVYFSPLCTPTPESSTYMIVFLKRLERRKNSFSISLILGFCFEQQNILEQIKLEGQVTSVAPALSSERCYSAPRSSLLLGIGLILPSITKYVVC